MKSFVAVITLALVAACNGASESKVPASPSLPAAAQAATAAATDAMATGPDCDEKAKKKVEITETEVKLGGGDTGCKLE